MEELKAIGAWIIEGLLLTLGGLMWWLWRTDRKEQNERMGHLEEKVSTLEINHIPRPDVERMVERIERDFKQEHASIINTINARHGEIREDIGELRESVMTLIERRSNRRDQ